jgi:hypothetical protein
MAWGAFCIKGKFPLFMFCQIMDADFHVEILETHLLPTARAHFGRRWRFQHDQDPKHSSLKAKVFLDAHAPVLID